MRMRILAVIVGLLISAPLALCLDIETGPSGPYPLEALSEGPSLSAVATVRPCVTVTIFTRPRGAPAAAQGSYAAPGTPQEGRYGTESANVRNSRSAWSQRQGVARIGQGSSFRQVSGDLENDEFMMRLEKYRKSQPAVPGGPDIEQRPEMPTNIRFQAPGPGMHESDEQVVLVVHSNSAGWTVTTEATALAGANGMLPPGQVFMRGPATSLAVDEGGGPGFVNLSTPKVVATGIRRGWLEIPVEFRLQTTKDDKVGYYRGQIFVDYFATP